MLAMAFGEAVAARAIHGDDVVLIKEPIPFEHFFANQDLDQPGDALLDRV